MTEPIMKKVQGDGVQINVAIWKGRGKPIICIHGITANCRCWDALAEVLAPDTLGALSVAHGSRSQAYATAHRFRH